MKKLISVVVVVILFFVGASTFIMGETINEVQNIEGSQRIRLEEIIRAGGGGGGGGSFTGGDVSGPTYLTGISNVFGPGSNYFRGKILLNTNGIGSSHTFNFVPNDVNSETFNFNVGNGALGVGIDIGDFYNQLAGGQRYGRIDFSTSQNALQMHTISASSLFIGANNANFLTFGTSGNSLITGVDSSSTHSYNGSTFTYNHLANINSGVLTIPTSTASGGLTNSSLIFTPSIFATNFTSFAPANLTSTSSTPVGVTNFIETVNSAAGTKMTRARMITTTNTFHAVATPTVNVIYTNTYNQRLWVSAVVRLPFNSTTNSAASLWSISAGTTNFQGRVASSSGVAVGTPTANMSVTGFVNPGDLYMVTNLNIGAGAPSVDPNMWVQQLF